MKNKKKKHSKPIYISEEEFNRMVIKKGKVPLPQKDSRGDSALNDIVEVNLGENYPEEFEESHPPIKGLH